MNFYLHINLLLGISFSVFWIFTRGLNALELRIAPSLLVRWGQVLVLSSPFLPLVLPFAPKRSMTAFDFQMPRTTSDGPQRLRITKVPKLRIDSTEVVESPKVAPAVSLLQQTEKAAPTFLFFFWISGLIFTTARFFIEMRHLHRTLHESNTVRKIGKTRIAFSERISVPFSTLFRGEAWVILPHTIIRNRGDYLLAVRHELEHHRKRDTFWAIVIDLLVCGFYLNPAIYFWKKEITEQLEFSCDDALIGRKRVSFHEYGSCLIRVAETALGNRQMLVGTTSMAAFSRDPINAKSFLRRRIEMLSTRKLSRPRKWVGTLIGTLALFITIAVAYATDQSTRKMIPEPSASVNLGSFSVDPTYQAIAEAALANGLKAEKAAEGFAIIADPNTGRILAVANIDLHGDKLGRWALSQLVEPASFTKTFVIAKALDQKITTPEETHKCENGSYQYGDRVYHDHKAAGWDELTTTDTLAISSDICSMKIAEKIAEPQLENLLSDFGFGPGGSAATFPEARSGQVPPPDENGKLRMLPAITSGFGFRVSPLEMLQSFGAIANGGILLAPLSADATDRNRTEIRRVMSPEAAEKMKEILRQVGIKGTAKHRIDSLFYSMAGKTATGYTSGLLDADQMNLDRKPDLAGFIGFAPVKNPQVEVYVEVRSPRVDSKNGAHGSVHAAPIFREIAEEALKEMRVAPDQLKAN